METLIAILIIVMIILIALRKIYVEKKKGAKCVGCSVYKNGGCSSKSEK